MRTPTRVRPAAKRGRCSAIGDATRRARRAEARESIPLPPKSKKPPSGGFFIGRADENPHRGSTRSEAREMQRHLVLQPEGRDERKRGSQSLSLRNQKNLPPNRSGAVYLLVEQMRTPTRVRAAAERGRCSALWCCNPKGETSLCKRGRLHWRHFFMRWVRYFRL